MELRHYGRILKRRLWIVLLLTLTAAAGSFLLRPQTETNYVASLRLLLSMPPEPRSSGYFGYDGYYSWLSSEYLRDDFAEVVKSREFADAVRQELGNNAPDVLTIQAGQSIEKTHRVLTLRVNARQEGQARDTAQAAVRVMEKRAPEYFAQLQSPGALLHIIDPPVVLAQTSTLRSSFNIALRTGLGLLAGIGLAFLLHYLDTTLYAGEEVERFLQLPVLGEIPPEK